MRETATKIAWKFLGKPYVWGGDDPVKGFDCSGFVIEILKSVGIMGRKGDWTAHDLMKRFLAKKTDNPREGCLVFWANEDGRIIHIEYCLDSVLSIGASGGGSRTQSEADAVAQNAYIKIRPFASRSGVWGFVDPF